MEKKKFKILLIEDEPNYHFRLINNLKKIENYEIDLAVSVNAIKNRLERGIKYDLIIFDIMMNPGDYQLAQTGEGTKTGWSIYNDEKLNMKNLDTKIIIWTRNNDIKNENWGENIKEIIIKDGNDDNQLVRIAKKALENKIDIEN